MLPNAQPMPGAANAEERKVELHELIESENRYGLLLAAARWWANPGGVDQNGVTIYLNQPDGSAVRVTIPASEEPVSAG